MQNGSWKLCSRSSGIGDDLLAGREYFFDHFIAPAAHFFGVAALAPSWRWTSQASLTSPRISSAF
jgi:hypothetical protein